MLSAWSAFYVVFKLANASSSQSAESISMESVSSKIRAINLKSYSVTAAFHH